MTIMDIARTDKAYRALLSEQYADIALLFKYIVDMFATEYDSFHTIELQDITVKERDIEEVKDMGFTTVKTTHSGRTLALDFKSLLANNMLPSAIFSDDVIHSLEFAGISFEHGECPNPVEILFDFEKKDDKGNITRPTIIVIRLVEDELEASAEDMFFIIGYIQYILSAAESAFAIEEYLSQHPEE